MTLLRTIVRMKVAYGKEIQQEASTASLSSMPTTNTIPGSTTLASAGSRLFSNAFYGGTNSPNPRDGTMPREILDLKIASAKPKEDSHVPLASFNPAYYMKPDTLKEVMEASKEKEVNVGDKLICMKHIRSGGAEAHESVEYDVVELIGEHAKLVPESNPHYDTVVLKNSTILEFFLDAHSEHIRKGHKMMVGAFEEEDMWREKDAISRIRHVDLSERFKPMLAVATTAREKREEVAIMRLLEAVAKGSKLPGGKFYDHPELEMPHTWEDPSGKVKVMRGRYSEPNTFRYRFPGELRKGEHRPYTPKMKADSFQ